MLGFNQPTIDFLSTQGLNQVQDLMELPLKQMDELIVQASRNSRPINQAGQQQAGDFINIPLIQGRRLKALRLWCNYCQATGQVVSATSFEEDDVPVWVRRLEDLDDADAETDRAKPPQLTSFQKWASWERKFREYLLTKRSKKTGAPLTYLIRDHDEVTPEIFNED
jgi:hypothetical protein